VSGFKGRRFGGETVLWAVRWYCRYGMSYRDLKQMMAGRGVPVDHIYTWAQRYAPEVEKRMRTAYAAIKGFEVIQGRRSGFSLTVIPVGPNVAELSIVPLCEMACFGIRPLHQRNHEAKHVIVLGRDIRNSRFGVPATC
jgi:hypothetical protein